MITTLKSTSAEMCIILTLFSLSVVYWSFLPLSFASEMPMIARFLIFLPFASIFYLLQAQMVFSWFTPAFILKKELSTSYLRAWVHFAKVISLRLVEKTLTRLGWTHWIARMLAFSSLLGLMRSLSNGTFNWLVIIRQFGKEVRIERELIVEWIAERANGVLERSWRSLLSGV